MTFDEGLLPPDKQRAILRLFGDDGRAWIAGFPDLLKQCVARWGLTLTGRASAGWPTNVIFYARGPAGESWVLKLGHPHPEMYTEMIALEHYAGRATPGLVEASRELGAILMARIQPGTTFRGQDSSIRRSKTPLTLMADLPVPCDAMAGLPLFDEWLGRAFGEFRDRFTADHGYHRHIDRAEAVFDDLRRRHPDNWLLHGDLHHENILLDSERGWVAIDPKGVIGPKVMECGRFLHNFLEDEIDGAARFAEASQEQLYRVMAVRIETFATTLGITRRDLASANYVDAVLSFCWTVNDQPDYSDFQPVDAALMLI